MRTSIADEDYRGLAEMHVEAGGQSDLVGKRSRCDSTDSVENLGTFARTHACARTGRTHAYARVEHVVTAAVGVREREDSKGKGETRGRDARRSRKEKKDAPRSEGIGRDGDGAWFIGRRTT